MRGPKRGPVAGPSERRSTASRRVEQLARRQRRCRARRRRSGTAAGRRSRPDRSRAESKPRRPRFRPSRPALERRAAARPRGRRGSRRDRRRRAASRDVNRPGLPWGLGSRRCRGQPARARPRALRARGPRGLAAGRNAGPALDRRLRAHARPARAGSLAAEGGTLVSGPQHALGAPEPRGPAALPSLLARGRRAGRRARPADRLRRASADPLLGHEWWRTLVGADTATPPGPGMPVTVVDTGVDLTHEEFAGRPNTSCSNAQSLDRRRRGLHGTAVARSSAAPVNGLGVVGVYPQAVLRSRRRRRAERRERHRRTRRCAARRARA